LAGANSGRLAAGVTVFNFGTSIELPAPVTTIGAFLAALENINQGASFSSALKLDPAATSIEGTVGPGPVLFSQNRCYVELVGLSLRATSNRVQEKPGSRENIAGGSAPGSVLVSLVTLAFGNITALNICTNGVLALGLAPSDFANATASNIFI
jgi:hypothetical protein